MVRVAVTGHRPDKLGGYAAHASHRAIRRHMRDFLEQAPEGELFLLSGGALGIDQFWIEVGLFLQLPIIAVLPFKGYDSKWPVASRQVYEKLLAQCHEVSYIGSEYKPDIYQKRNEFLVDNSDVLVAYWNGSESGTKNCVDYAISRNKIVNEFNPEDIINNA